MSKPEWGIKRTCQDCSSVFYDMNKSPIYCPKCKSVYDEAALTKKHPLDPSEPIEHKDELPLQEEYIEEDQDFYLDTPAELIESLEDLEEGYEPTQLIKS